MNKMKLSKFLIMFLSIALFFEVAPLRDVNAVAATQYNRSVREMMARRHNASSGFWKSEQETQPKVSTMQSGSPMGARTAVTTTIYPEGAVYSKASSQSYSLASLFSSPDKDGSLFPGGPCKNCHKSGPIFPGGSCKRCLKSGPLIPGGSCKRCLESGPLVDTGPCENCKEPEPEPEPIPVAEPVYQPKYAISYNDYIVQALAKDCCAMAPIYLEHVDFNLFADEENVTKNKMGNYRFRIFGCRRYDREAVLNHGRLMEKNMHFSQIFEEVTGDCYNIVPMPQDICLQNEPAPMPEYILTAEITNYFMNVCDGYDYENVAPTNKRSGTSEMTVRWKLSNPSKTKIVWEGETTGYADLNLGQFEGEIALVHAAFADAAENLKVARGFEDQLMVRLTPEELAAERDALIDEEAALDPAKCRFAKQLYQAQQCELTREGAEIYNCPAVQERIEQEACPVEDLPCEAKSEPCKGEGAAENLPCAESAPCEGEGKDATLPCNDEQLICEGEGCYEALMAKENPAPCSEAKDGETAPCDQELVLCEGEDCVQTLEPEPAPCDCDACHNLPVIEEDSGLTSDHSYQIAEQGPCDCDACKVPEPVLEEAPVIEEDSGIHSDYDYQVLDNCIDEKGEIISGGDCTIVDDTWVETSSKEEALESLCITARKPYDVLTPEHLYKIRASVVEISNMAGKKGSGLIVSDEFVLTSADLVDNENNINKVRTINGKEFTARAVRVNPSKNTALLMLDIKTEYSPLSLGLDLPKSGETGFMALGMLDVETFDNGTENYLDNSGKVLGYRYSDDKGSEIIVDTHVQDLVIGSVLIDSHGDIVGMAHTGQKTDSGKDLFLPTETALRSVGLTICDYVYEKPSPFRQTVYKPVTELILHSEAKAPEHLKKKERK